MHLNWYMHLSAGTLLKMHRRDPSRYLFLSEAEVEFSQVLTGSWIPD